MSARETNMVAKKYLHLLASSAIVQVLIALGGAVGAITMPSIALASAVNACGKASGRSRWASLLQG